MTLADINGGTLSHEARWDDMGESILSDAQIRPSFSMPTRRIYLADTQFEALHQVRAATVAILAEYVAALALPQFEADPLLSESIALHQRHAGELLNRQSALGYSTDGDSIEMVMQDGDALAIRNASDLVREKERKLAATYEEALAGWFAEDDVETYALLKTQYQQLQSSTGL